MAPTSIPARSGVFAHLQPGQKIKIINTHGTQVVDTWAFAPSLHHNRGSSRGSFQFKYLSMCHTRSALLKLTLATNDALRDNQRQPMLTLVEDTSEGVHDLLFAACDKHRYAQLGVEGYHDSCGDNLKSLVKEISSTSSKTEGFTEAMAAAIASASLVAEGWTPDPLNLFMNVEVGKGGAISMAAPPCPKGGYVVLKAETECVVLMSACPMDLTKLYQTQGAQFDILSD